MIAKCRSHLRHYINPGNSVKSEISAPMVNSDQEHILQAEWALKSKRKVKRFSSDMREWVKAHFVNGEQTGKKLLGEEMNRLQRTSFPVDE